MNDIILLKLGEIVLKGLNRKAFERKLLSNIAYRLKPIGNFKISCLQSTHDRPRSLSGSLHG